MTWKVRHEGSPQSTDGLTLDEVTAGLLNGQWEPTDEVRGPGDADWRAFENHPQFAELAAEIEPPPPRVFDDETRLDMTPLIDVCLVLLIFFILTTTYASLQKIIEAAAAAADKPDEKVRVVKQEEVEETMIRVDVRRTKDGTEIRIEGKPVEPGDVRAELARFRDAAKRRKVLLDFDPKVSHGVIVGIQDAASSAGIDEVLFLHK
jgi:biopolymer transport protein ExbD